MISEKQVYTSQNSGVIDSEESKVLETRQTPENNHYSRALKGAEANLTDNDSTAGEGYTVQSTDSNSIHSNSDTSTGVSVDNDSSNADSIAHPESNIETAPTSKDAKGDTSVSGKTGVDGNNSSTTDVPAQSTDHTSTPTDISSASDSDTSDNNEALSQERIESEGSVDEE